MFFDGSISYLMSSTTTLDLSPSVTPAVSIEIYLVLNAVINNRGWVVSTDNGNFDRSIILHDDRFGSGGIAFGVGFTYTSTLPAMPIGQWTHIVGTWQNGANCYFYVNGSSTYQILVPSNDGGQNFSVGSAQWVGHAADVNIAWIRIYNKILAPSDVDTLYQQALALYTSTPCGKRLLLCNQFGFYESES
jgi:hypothetical protein